MRELTIHELKVVSGGAGPTVGGDVRAAAISILLDKFISTVIEVTPQVTRELRTAVEDYNKKQDVKITPQMLKDLEKTLERKVDEKNKSADYCGCGSNYH